MDAAKMPQMALIKVEPHLIFALSDFSIELAAVAMKSSAKVAKRMSKTYELPPELKELVPKSGPFFKLS